MPRNRDLKRLVRTRMRKTGEAYTAARAQVTRQSPRATAARLDYAALAGTRDAVIVDKTGRTWEQWTRVLDDDGAAAMPHRDIAALVSTRYGIPTWWSQTVTVGYERIRGLRERGQRRDGTWEANKSRTYAVPVARLFDAWANAKTRRRWLDTPGLTIRTAKAPKTMRLGWAEGGIVVVGFTAKSRGKSVVALSHTKLPDRATADRLKQYWSSRLDALAVVLAVGSGD